MKKGGKLKEKKKAVSNTPDYKTVIQFNYLLDQASKGERPLFYDTKTNMLHKETGWSALSLLDVFKKMPLASDEAVAPTMYGTVTWLGLSIAEGVNDKEELILQKTLENCFESIPLEYRSDLYTDVQTRVFNIPRAGEEVDSDDSDNDDGASGEHSESHKRVLVLCLLHEEDRFMNLEEEMPARVTLTRGIRRASVNLSMIQSIKEMYEESLPFESYLDRLFGPQEDELGDEGMNPLHFAKFQRQRVKAAKDGIDKVDTMSPEMVDQQLAMRGLSVLGQKRERVKRLKKAFERQAAISGFGELSAFGGDMVSKLFKLFKVHKNMGERLGQPKKDTKKPTPAEIRKKESGKAKKAGSSGVQDEEEEEDLPGMSLWDFNNFLASTGSPTLYDFREYKEAMHELGFLQDKNFGLTPEGLAAYYEQYGGIGRDMKNIGIGSLAEKAKGRLQMSVHYDAAAISSLLDLIEKHSVMYPHLKYLLAFVTSISDWLYEADYDNIAEMLGFARNETFRQLKENVKTPGWFSSFIHSCSEWLADGDDGVLVSLRQGVHETFGRYSRMEEAYPEVIAATQIPQESVDLSDNVDTAVSFCRRQRRWQRQC